MKQQEDEEVDMEVPVQAAVDAAACGLAPD